MNPSRLFILRPVATTLLMVALLLSGLVALRFLPVAALPQVDYPTIQVQTFYPGASPDVMTSSVTAPLEVKLGQIPNLAQMRSSSAAGVSIITLQFTLSIALDVAEQEVQAAINASSNLLPSDLPAPPIYAKVNPADAPVLTLALTSDTLSLSDVQALADTRIAQKISQLPGVGLVSLSGGQKPAVRVQADPRKLAAYGLGMDDLRSFLGTANVNTPKGSFDGPARAETVNANDQLHSGAEFAQQIIAYKNGAALRLGDVATVIDGVENEQLAAWKNDTPAIIVNIQRQPGANVIAVVDQIRALLPQLQAGLPASVDVAVLSDRTTTIRASISDVGVELALAILLVILVIYVFLRSPRATLIPSLSVPLSLVATLAVMYFSGFSLNNLSLMALTIATGFVVDDAIVVIENISRYLEEGDSPLAAALKGAEQIGFTIISLTVSLVAVLIPLLFMGDVVGRLFREFAVTLASTILISGVVALTLVPMACALLLRPPRDTREGAIARRARLLFDGLIAVYGRALDVVFAHQGKTLAIFGLSVVATGWMYVVIPKGFFPEQDTGLIQAMTLGADSVSFSHFADLQRALGQAIAADPDVENLSSFIGVDGQNATPNAGRMLIALKPEGERHAPVETVIARLQAQAERIAGIRLYLQPVQDLTLDGTFSPAQYQFTLESAHGSDLDQWAPKLVAALQNRPELRDVTSDLSQQGLAVTIDIDRDRAAQFGITPATIDNALYDAFGQRIVSTIFTTSSQQRVILEADPGLRNRLSGIDAIYLPSSSGAMVPLPVVAKTRIDTAPLMIAHLGQFPAATVSFNLAPGTALGAALDAIRAEAAKADLPASVTLDFQGSASAFEAALSNQLLLILAALVTVYIVLGILYESFVHPLTILSTLPSAGIGALLALMLAGQDLTIVAIIGLVLLIGIVKKNAIMMIDFALEAEREGGLAPKEAIRQACLLRFRPILMTTLAAVLGALPLMLGSGVGSELRNPLGITIVGGLLLSQLLTLFTTPVIYLWFDRLAARLRGERPAA